MALREIYITVHTHRCLYSGIQDTKMLDVCSYQEKLKKGKKLIEETVKALTPSVYGCNTQDLSAYLSYSCIFCTSPEV